MKRNGIVGFWLVVVLVGISLLPALSLQAQELIQTTVTLTPVADASIEFGPDDTNFGSAEMLAVYYKGENEIAHALIRFNLAAAVLPEAIIDSARLNLFLEGSEGTAPVNLEAALLTEDWVESQVTWNIRPAAREPVVTALVDTSRGYKSLDVTDIVRVWHNAPHYGLELRGPEGETDYSLIFASREHGEMPPQLVVTYHLPQPQQVYLHAVEPPGGRPGEELELALLGGGFGNAVEVWVAIGEIEVLDAWIESAERVIAQVFIPEDAPPGPRPVEVVAVFGPNEEFPAGLEAGFLVLEPEPMPSPFVDGVEPQQVARGSQVELNVFGGNFLPEAWVQIGGEGVLVHRVEFVNAEHLRAFVEVWDDAPLGWREVIVINPDEQAGGHEHALEVIDGEGPPPGPPPLSPPPSPISPTATPGGRGGGGEPGPIPNWVWASATVLLSGLSFTVGRALALKSKLSWTEKARVQWRVEAQNKLPEPKKICQWACKVNVSADLLDRWRVTTIELTPLRPSKGEAPPPKRVEGDVLAPLNDLANIGKILHREDEIRRRLAPIVDALLAQIMAWEQKGQTPASIRVEAQLEAPINVQFKLCHCEQTKKGLGWVDRVTWKGKLNQPGGEFLGVLRGPTAEEPDFIARARRELEACLLDLVSVARFRL